MTQDALASMEAHVNTLQGVDELSYTAIAQLNTLETDVRLVSKRFTAS